MDTVPGVKTPAGRDRSLSDIAFDASRSTTVRFCDVGSSRSAAHEDVSPPPAESVSPYQSPVSQDHDSIFPVY
jgi:hypothetical protein